MFNCKEIYRVTIEDVVFKLNKAHSPYIDLITKTLDEKELTINVSYYFIEYLLKFNTLFS